MFKDLNFRLRRQHTLKGRSFAIPEIDGWLAEKTPGACA
jgi:hypothetical protein